MGRYSDSDDGQDRYKRSKKKKKNRSRSRSKSTEKHSAKYKKSKKSKTKRHSRSRSKDRTRDRSRSYDKYRRSRSKSRSRRSRSRSRRRSRSRSKSISRRSRRRSRSLDRRSRSRSYDRYSSRYSSKSRRSRSSSMRRSRDRDKHSRQSSRSPKIDIGDHMIPGYDDMTAGEQNQARLNLALKAAADADQKLKEQGAIPKDTLTTAEIATRQIAIQKIEKDDFAPSTFSSNRKNQTSTKTSLSTHDDAIFGIAPINATTNGNKTIVIDYKNPVSIIHPRLFISPEEKMKKWKQKLVKMRQSKLQGERM